MSAFDPNSDILPVAPHDLNGGHAQFENPISAAGFPKIDLRPLIHDYCGATLGRDA
jgi:hypothetical protein